MAADDSRFSVKAVFPLNDGHRLVEHGVLEHNALQPDTQEHTSALLPSMVGIETERSTGQNPGLQRSHPCRVMLFK